jgi:hypothetical protein
LGPYRKSLSQRAISLNFFPPVYRSRASEILIVYYIIELMWKKISKKKTSKKNNN